MKKLYGAVFSVALVFAIIPPLPAQIQGQWTNTGPMQSDREFNAQVKLTTGKVLSIGGVDNSNSVLSSAELYSSSSSVWALTGSMAEARKLFPAVVLTSGKVLVSGGLGVSNNILGDAELYDPTTGTWSPAGSLAVPRAAHTATLLPDGMVLVTGGCVASSCTGDTAVSELYDPTSNTWSTTGSLNLARAYHSAVLLKTGKVLVIGGSNGYNTSCELYDPSTGTWSSAASTNMGRYLNTTTLMPDGKVLVTGNATGRFPSNSAELYDPAANHWTLTGTMTNARYAHAAILLGDGTVLVSGGEGQSISCGKDCTGFIPTAKSEIFNETTGKFTATTSLPRALAYHSVTLLSNGRALEDGGTGYTATCCVVVNNAEFYTPLTLTFSATSLNLGILRIGLTSASQTVTVTNVSGHAVKFSSIASYGNFAQTDTCPSTLNAGQNCTITVTFTPTKAGTRNGGVTLKDNCPGSSSQTIALTGLGETLALGFNPASLNLGSVPVGSSSVQTATLINDGSAPVNVTGFAVSPANHTYTQTNNCPATLNVQQSCIVTVTFTPPDVFTYKATVSVMNSAGAAPTLALTGIGLDGGN